VYTLIIIIVTNTTEVPATNNTNNDLLLKEVLEIKARLLVVLDRLDRLEQELQNTLGCHINFK
jgi:hypothetical protein